MKPVWNYGDAVLSLPARARAHAAEAGAIELQALLLLTDPAVTAGGDAAGALAGLLGCTRARAAEAISFWCARGVLTDADTASADSAKVTEAAEAAEKIAVIGNEGEETEEKKLRRADVLPNYTTEELAGILEHRRETATLINACEQTWGKIFNTHEVNQILGLTDYLGLDGDYILELLSYAVRCERKSLRFVEKLAFDLYDEGVTDPGALQTRLQWMRHRDDFEHEVRTLFGLGHRALTTKEKKMLANWDGFGYDAAIVRRAYEVTVDAIGEPALPYANAILERWNADGLKTAEEIDANIAERKSAAGEPTDGSFDTDDFFEAALRRSYGADYDRLGLGKVAKNAGGPAGGRANRPGKK